MLKPQDKSIPSCRQMFSPCEDEKLRDLVKQYGEKDWKKVAEQMNNRTARQCRERYKNYLAPNMVNGPWTQIEDCLLILKYRELGPKWSKISQYFQNRSDINVKNRWASIKNKCSLISLNLINSYLQTMFNEKSIPVESKETSPPLNNFEILEINTNSSSSIDPYDTLSLESNDSIQFTLPTDPYFI